MACVGVIVVAATLIATPAAARPRHPGRGGPLRRPGAPPVRRAHAGPTIAGGPGGDLVRHHCPADRPGARGDRPYPLHRGRLDRTISYPQLGCAGHLLLVSVLARTFTLEQGITRGQQSCESGVVLLSPQGSSSLAYKFRRSSAPSPAGVLSKTGS